MKNICGCLWKNDQYSTLRWFVEYFQAIELQREKFKAQLAAKKGELSEEQTKLLMEEHEQQLDILERNMEAEKLRQSNALADKIAAKQRKREAALMNKQQAENQEQLVEDRKERQQLIDKQVRIVIELLA